MSITDKRRFEDIGENVASVFLEKHGFKIIERNYLRKWGEIDIVATRGSMLHFVEVKSAHCDSTKIVSSETSIRAEENMHPQKIKRLHRAIQTYLLEKGIDNDWQLDLVVVRIDEVARIEKAEILENII